jgi:hypothetical protein
MSKSERPGDYDVGYAKPPKATQFKKGTSGNPKGRPRKSQSHQAIASRVLNEIRRLGGQPRGAKVRFTVLELIVMNLKQLAAAGHLASAKFYTRVQETFGTPTPPQKNAYYLVVPETLTMEEWVLLYSPKDEPPGEVSSKNANHDEPLDSRQS